MFLGAFSGFLFVFLKGQTKPIKLNQLSDDEMKIIRETDEAMEKLKPKPLNNHEDVLNYLSHRKPDND